MGKMIKINQGITLMALVITVTILLIIASVATYTGVDTIKYAKFMKAKSQMEIMITEVSNLYNEYTNGKEEILEYGLELIDPNCDETIRDKTFSDLEITDTTGYKFFSKDYITNYLDIEGIDYEFLINIATRDIILFGGIKYQDKIYYTPEDFEITIVENIPINTAEFKSFIGRNPSEPAEVDIFVYDIKFYAVDNGNNKDEANVGKFKIEYKGEEDTTWKSVQNPTKTIYSETNSAGITTDYEAYLIPITYVSRYQVKVSTINGAAVAINDNYLELTDKQKDVVNKKAYLTTLASGTYFKEDEYRARIKNISFVNYINTDNSLVTYDLSEDQDKLIIAWIDNNYNLYIGSKLTIYTKDFSYAFYNMTGVERFHFGNLNTSEMSNMERTFYLCSSLKYLDVSNFDTSQVTNMYRTFSSCKSLTELDLSSWDTSQVRDMHRMFYSSSSITKLNISSFKTPKLKNTWQMFYDCSSLVELDLSNFDTSNVTNMSYMFCNCSSLTSLALSNFDTNQATDMSYMFCNCSSLTSLDLSNFDTSNVTNMNYMFSRCNSIKILNISSFDTSKVTDMENMFSYDQKLETLYLNNATFTSVTSYGSMFYDLSTSVSRTFYVKDENAKTFIENRLNDSGVTGVNVTTL